ncbi:hypothetical protein CFE70_002213 [Pyrenophora teres f. teres 0-1]|uniref:CAP-Gly domain-containing protein n=2 Tax=Pyrenophora teres f. teres TaxID=97479 RepID=E3RX67_PYRTT|nr:hypothetical protein PTT_13950 [Pyrenophora teres f. teres 0-1]KAE8842785.1 hypothetical protein HRS9139_02082 [Pyrenophora teres f. teres]KAE8850156.1 hypothetical protein PTNB85_00572 [Pyrenophora teres f. teres]KAE8870484.1 hypothetical protein PTNB29_00828 [Pyrenophora teres f. teres]KAK1915783.1 hypothetical protein P3342_003596 [Pyrenophora teres f. teres]
MTTDIYIGKRLSFATHLCTIRYHGTLPGTTGPWLGVEWDDPTRGKHDGSHNGTRYFTCLHTSPTCASFIRPTRKPDPTRSFVQALKHKYASEQEEEDFRDPDVHVVFNHQPPKTVSFNGKPAEEIGFDKIRKQLAQLEELKIIILDGLCMVRPEARGSSWMDGGEKRDIADACPKAVELDLSRNLFEDWREVAAICEQLPGLRSLRVDGTRFHNITLSPAEQTRCLHAFKGITSLKLEDTLLPWTDLAQLTHLFPSLTTFSAASNLFTTLTLHEPNPQITELILEDNLLTSLSSLSNLAKLPNLQRLILKQNKVSELITPDTAIPVFPPTVREVDLSFNEISTWAFIEQLAHVFPGLQSLRVSHNPLYSSLQAPDGRTLTADDGYMLTLARLGNLKTLNHSPINEKERLNAETYYLSMIAKEVQFASENLREQILKSHPRYAWLCEEYGEPDVQRSVNAVNPNSLAARLLCVKFYLATSTSTVFETEVPMSSTAYTVLGLVGKHFSIKPMQCRLVWETGDWMSVRKSATDIVDDDWDSEDSEAEVGMERIMREAEIVPGTRSIGTWVDGSVATIRVEVK